MGQTAGLTCIVTIHGIGFQQPPDDAKGLPGYADDLHRALKAALPPGDLADDPYRPKVSGAVYVQSGQQGLRRLGEIHQDGTIDITGADLVDPADTTARFAHVALVYADAEDWRNLHVASAADGAMRALLASGRYLSITTLPRWLWRVVGGLRFGSSTPVPSLQRRGDLRQTPTDGASGLWAVLWGLVNDVCAYVCENDLRTRVRGFVWDALIHLAARPDVDQIVINSHSQGTVVALDGLRNLDPDAADRVKGLITAGSPLRKYVDLFSWGDEIGPASMLPWLPAWTNFWDPADPVADPLCPSGGWKAGGSVPSCAGTGETLFVSVDPQTGSTGTVNIVDVAVSNTKNSGGGGLQAHNYWDNKTEYLPHVRRYLLDLVSTQPAPRPVAVSSSVAPRQGRLETAKGGRNMAAASNGKTVQFPGRARKPDGADLALPITNLLNSLMLLGVDDDYDKQGLFTKPPQSVALIEANATALAKGWSVVLAGVGGLSAVIAVVQGIWGGESVPVRVAFVAGAALMLAAGAIALALIIAGDVRGRSGAQVAEYRARAQVTAAFLQASHRCLSDSGEVSKEAMLLAGALHGNFLVKLTGSSEYERVLGIRLDPIERLQVKLADDWVGMDRLEVFKTIDPASEVRNVERPSPPKAGVGSPN